MMTAPRLTADDLAEDILARQGHRDLHNVETDLYRVQAYLTTKQAAYLFNLIAREQGPMGLWKSYGHQQAQGLGWTLTERRGGNAVLESYKPADWHPLDYSAPVDFPSKGEREVSHSNVARTDVPRALAVLQASEIQVFGGTGGHWPYIAHCDVCGQDGTDRHSFNPVIDDNEVTIFICDPCIARHLGRDLAR